MAAQYRAWEGLPDEKLITDIAKSNAVKLHWFLQHGYAPHVFQLVFHGARAAEGNLYRFRHLVAGRRGGKTLSAAEDVAFYMTHPQQYWLDFHGKNSRDQLWTWVLAKNYPEGFPSMKQLLEVFTKAGLVPGQDYRYHKGEKYIEMLDGSLLQFKTADDPQSLRGAGLNLLWMDEAADMPSGEAYEVTSPALGDKQGAVISTTTPKGKNWYFDEFFSKEALTGIDGPKTLTVEYRSLDNPHFKEEEWKRYQQRYHPQLFQQEFMARFDAFQGVELHGDWLHYYEVRDLPRKRDGNGVATSQLDLKLFVGVDPAISLSEKADRFAMALIGVTHDNTQAYLLDLFAGRIPFPEQIDKLREWHIKYRPQLIGIESNAYQAALAQQVMRMANFPPVVPMLATGKKHERILSMAPYFKIGRIQIHKNHRDFIDEWLGYDSTLRHGKDDTLDAVEIALRTAGALLPDSINVGGLNLDDKPTGSVEELAKADRLKIRERRFSYDDEMGDDF